MQPHLEKLEDTKVLPQQSLITEMGSIKSYLKKIKAPFTTISSFSRVEIVLNPVKVHGPMVTYAYTSAKSVSDLPQKLHVKSIEDLLFSGKNGNVQVFMKGF